MPFVTAGLLCLPALAFAQPSKSIATTVAYTVSPDTNNAAADTRSNTVAPPPDSITTFEQLDMPFEMEMEFSKLSPKGVLLFRDEFQQMHDGYYGQAQRTIKVWYIDDHIIGYVLEQPFDAGTDPAIRKQKINIPVSWCCVPTIVGHPEHCAATLGQLREIEAGNGCTGWHLKLPPPIEFEHPIKLQKPKKDKTRANKDSTNAAGFGHAGKTSDKEKRDRKKKEKKDTPFEQVSTSQPAIDSTTVSSVKP
jgi:hypothetical protein